MARILKNQIDRFTVSIISYTPTSYMGPWHTAEFNRYKLRKIVVFEDKAVDRNIGLVSQRWQTLDQYPREARSIGLQFQMHQALDYSIPEKLQKLDQYFRGVKHWISIPEKPQALDQYFRGAKHWISIQEKLQALDQYLIGAKHRISIPEKLQALDQCISEAQKRQALGQYPRETPSIVLVTQKRQALDQYLKEAPEAMGQKPARIKCTFRLTLQCSIFEEAYKFDYFKTAQMLHTLVVYQHAKEKNVFLLPSKQLYFPLLKKEY